MNDQQVTPRFKQGHKVARKATEVARYGLDVPGKLTKTGWEPPSQLSFEEWKRVGAVFMEIEGRVHWAVGDWWCAKDRFKYGERADAWANGEWGDVSFERLRNIGYTARQVERHVRHDVLSFEHHYAVASLEQADQIRWLDCAVAKAWTLRELRNAVSKWKRGLKHDEIRRLAKGGGLDGPFPLIYADPPWQFHTYSELGKDMTSPDKHYPTISDDEIAAYKVGDKLVSEIACDDAVLFLWCTASNVHRALPIMEAWGFEYKTHAIWDKQRTGTGYLLLNQHEVLLWGTRGKMPGPLWLHSSVFSFPRGKHSEKPPEVRQALEKMYPRFGAEERIELFARGDVPGWTTYGYEAK